MAESTTETALPHGTETVEQLQQRIHELNEENASRRHALKQLGGERDALRTREAGRVLDQAVREAIRTAIDQTEGSGRVVETTKIDALCLRLRETLSEGECIAWDGVDAGLSEPAREALRARAADLVHLASHEQHVVPPPRPHGEGPRGRGNQTAAIKNAWDPDCQPERAGRGRALLRETAEQNRQNLDALVQS